ncbi:MAG: dihydroneopterin aldolase [Sulfurovum sp.]|nr:dihydroneopterin aldolase [Sulfurovum sp.]
MTIHIEALTFDVIIGLLDFERETPQSVILNIQLDYPYEAHAFINYAHIVSLVQATLHKERYELLEEALLGLSVFYITSIHTYRSFILS